MIWMLSSSRRRRSNAVHESWRGEHGTNKKLYSFRKGAVGICAGAYLFTDTPGYACMHINGGKAIDIEHDNRGHGISAFSLTAEGKKLFPELAKRE